MLSVVLGLLAGSAAAASTPSNLKSRAAATAYISSSDGTYKLSSWTAPVQGSGSSSDWDLTIDDTSSGYKQTVMGFGAAVTDATVAVFNDLSSSTRAALYEQLFTSAGVNFSMLRHTIGSSDLSADPAYTYDDNGGSADPDFNSFNLGDRGTAMAEMLAAMKAVNSEITVFGSVWSPPGWMKLNGVIDGTTTNNNLNDGYLSSNFGSGYPSQYADYFVKYIQAYENLGATIDSFALQNEPLNSNAGYPTMYQFSYEQAELINSYVGPALSNAGLSSKIWAYDHNTDQPSFPEVVVSEASSYVPAVAWHCYASSLDWSVLTTFHDSYPDKDQYMTECWTSPSTAWNQAANFTVGPLQNWARGVMAWTLGTDTDCGPHLSSGGCSDCSGLVEVNTSSDTYEFTIDYYMLGQFSKFIPKGATILSGTGSYSYNSGANGIQSVASLNPDGTRTVVIQNTFGNDVGVQLTTSSGQTWNGNIYENSVVTWILPAV